MARGFLAGSVWGAVVAAPVLGVASLLGELPPENTPPEVPNVEVPASADAGTINTNGTTVSETSGEAASQGTDTPIVGAPQTEVTAPIADTNPADIPQTSGIEGSMAEPEAGTETAVSVDTVEPVLPNPQALAPVSPAPEEDLSISTEPAQPVAPAVEEGGAFAAPAEEEFVFVETPEGDTETSAEEETVETAPETTVEDVVEPELVEPEAEPEAMVEPEITDDADTTEAVAEASEEQPAEALATEQTAEVAEVEEPVVAAEGEAAVASDEPTVAETEGQDDPNEQDETNVQVAEAVNQELEGTPSDETSLEPQTNVDDLFASLVEPSKPAGTPAGDLAKLAPEIKVNRLTDTETEDTSDADVSRNALVDYAIAFDNPDDKPLLSVVLIDDGAGGLGPTALTSFTFPVTVAINAAQQNATELMQSYRDAGAEVMVLTNVPRGAQAADLEVAFEAYRTAVPEAVAVLDGGENGFQEDRALVSQVTEILASRGQGLLTQAKGLNSVQRVAQEAGVASALVFRDLDVAGQDARVIRRFLDQAAFTARQKGDVVVLGRMRADTISALLLWGAGDRADQVELAPISAVLTGSVVQ
ncbi:MAG: divergent polysaccharide deacetylase family protein [Paracoccaceae bacterium]|nr:divergent polysaccharide deacetylase family protein [Paracoccaceae bacterium]